MNEARFDENMSPDIEVIADEWEEQQAILKDLAEAEPKVILMVVWTDNDGDEKTEEFAFSTEGQAMNFWERIEGEFDETGRWFATDFEIL